MRVVRRRYIGISGAGKGSLLNRPFLGGKATFALRRQTALKLRNLLPATIHALRRRKRVICTRLNRLASTCSGRGRLVGVCTRGHILFCRIVKGRIARLLPIVCAPAVTSAIVGCSQSCRVPRSTICLSIGHPRTVHATLLGNYGNVSRRVGVVIVASNRKILNVNS